MSNAPSEISVIIPAAGTGKRMKSYGPKPLIKVGDSSIINSQISTIQSLVNVKDIILICGFKAERLMDLTPDAIIKIENESYEDNNVARSIGMGLRAVRKSDTVMIVYGDLVFNSAAIECLDWQRSCIIVEASTMGDAEVGCIVGANHRLANMMYDLPSKWGQIAVFKGRELELLKELCWDKKNYRKFGFEIINRIIEKGGVFHCVQGDDVKIMDIDTSKDIQRAKGILT
jgi:choline kinase